MEDISSDPSISATNVSSETSFEKLTTGAKFKLIRSIVTPQSANINRDGSVAIKVQHEDVETLLNTKSISGTPVEIQKDKYKNFIRGKIKHNYIIMSTEEEIVEELQAINCVKAHKLEIPKRDSEKNIVKGKDNKMEFVYSAGLFF